MYELSVGESLSEFEEEQSMKILRRAADYHANEDARRSVRFKVFLSSSDVSDVLADTRQYLDDASIDTTDFDDHYQINLTRTIRRADIPEGQRTIEGSFGIFRIGTTNIWAAITGAEPDFYKRGVLWLLKQSEPVTSEVFVNSSDMETILDNVRSSLPLNTEIRVKKAVAYTRREEGTISFETNPYKEVFRVSEQNDKYVDKIRFVIRDETEDLLTAFVSRDGQLKFEAGDVSLFFNHFLPEYATIGQRKADVLSDKERSEETGDVEQIRVRFDEEVFHTPDDHDALIEALGNLSRASMTVYHRNPYAHLSVLDFVDGSCCDVFVTEPDEISLVPSYRGSVNSLMRISEQISREFDEGEVTEVGEPEVSASDFFAD